MLRPRRSLFCHSFGGSVLLSGLPKGVAGADLIYCRFVVSLQTKNLVEALTYQEMLAKVERTQIELKAAEAAAALNQHERDVPEGAEAIEVAVETKSRFATKQPAAHGRKARLRAAVPGVRQLGGGGRQGSAAPSVAGGGGRQGNGAPSVCGTRFGTSQLAEPQLVEIETDKWSILWKSKTGKPFPTMVSIVMGYSPGRELDGAPLPDSISLLCCCEGPLSV